MTKYKENILALFTLERPRLIFWYPVSFILGILVYFKLFITLPIIGIISSLAISLISICICHHHQWWRFCTVTMLMFILGYHATAIRVANIDTIMLNKNRTINELTGTIHSIEQGHNSSRILLEPNQNDHPNLPKLVRFMARTSTEGASIGDKVMLKAKLEVIKIPDMPDMYDYRRHAFFQGIGAQGYALSPVNVIEKNTDWGHSTIKKLRHTIGQRITDENYGEHSGIIKALLLGMRKDIPPEITENIRHAGLAHLLAISGMHVSLVCALFFMVIRRGLVLFPSTKGHVHNKTIAALVAMIGASTYVMLAGAPISAQRALMMASLVLIAIIIGRKVCMMRLVSIAAITILSFRPEMALTPGFHMSFIAVVALIGFFANQSFEHSYYPKHPLAKLVYYLKNIILASLVAGLATAPFAMFHFQHSSNLGLLANMLAVPLTSIIIMPLGIMALLTMPLGLSMIPLYFMDKAIEVMVAIATIVANYPYAYHTTSIMPVYALLCFSLAILWYSFFLTKLRYAGIIPCLLAIILWAQQPVANIIIPAHNNWFAIHQANDQAVHLIGKKPTKKQRKQLAKHYNNTPQIIIDQHVSSTLNCNKMACYSTTKNGEIIAIIIHPKALTIGCKHAKYVVNLTYYNAPCATLTNRWKLHKYGTHYLYTTKHETPVIRAYYTGEKYDSRPWH